MQDIERVLFEAELDEHYGINLDFISLLEQDANIAHSIVQSPQHMLDALETALLTAQVNSLDQHHTCCLCDQRLLPTKASAMINEALSYLSRRKPCLLS